MNKRKFDYNEYETLIQRHSSLAVGNGRKDFTFTFVDSDVKICAHKHILQAASTVFETMISGSFAETDEAQITDIKPEIFQLLIEYVYY